jgi:hypothetical protein
MREKVNQLETDLKKKSEENDNNMDEIIKLERSNKQLLGEKEKQKFRIQKLLQRKGKFDSGFKTCKNCGKEYNEKENFNWSCRQHQSDYGGEMWWCCGKTGKDQPGCKFSKHESKEDEEEAMSDGEEPKQKTTKNVRCFCCKEMGHKIDDCPRDPNMRTKNNNVESEFSRIQKMKDFRKLFADTLVQTTHMLKKSVAIPIKGEEDGDVLEVPKNTQNPFMRGVMEFDDYNYKMHNQYVLVPDPTEAKDKQISSARSFKKNLDKDALIGENPPLSRANLANNVADDYRHDVTHIPLSEAQIEKMEAEELERIAEEERKKEEEAAKKTA